MDCLFMHILLLSNNFPSVAFSLRAYCHVDRLYSLFTGLRAHQTLPHSYGTGEAAWHRLHGYNPFSSGMALQAAIPRRLCYAAATLFLRFPGRLPALTHCHDRRPAAFLCAQLFLWTTFSVPQNFLFEPFRRTRRADISLRTCLPGAGGWLLPAL